jgi:hypothetical protein
MKIYINKLFLITLIWLAAIGCDKKDKIEKHDSGKEQLLQFEVLQPLSEVPDKTFAGTIGFWDFNMSGKNQVLNEARDWVIEGIDYGNKGLVFNKNVTKKNVAKSRVQLYNSSNSSIGLFQQRYFSGAVKFIVEKDSNEAFSYPLLSFGYDFRFLDLEIFNGEIKMMTNNSNISYNTDMKVQEKVWNVLYFRYECFLPLKNNKFYIQLNNSKEIELNLKDFKIDEFAKDSDINLGFSSRGCIFKGGIDWVIIARGRMTPENVQYLINDFKN